MQNYRGFISWMFRGWYRDITMWGFIVGVVALIAMIMDASLMTVWILASVALALVMFDLAWKFLRFQYSLYVIERNRVARELERK